MRDSLLIHKVQIEPLKNLSFEEKGRIFSAIIEYQFEQKEPDLSPVLLMAFNYIKNQIDIDNRKYSAICERNRENGIKGGRPFKNEKPSGLFGNPKNPDKPKKADNDNDNDNDILFVRFWDLYDKKNGKKRTVKLWGKLSEKEKDLIFIHVPKYKQAKPDKQYRKDPERYLLHRTWEDEIIKPTNGQFKQSISSQKIFTNEFIPGN